MHAVILVYIHTHTHAEIAVLLHKAYELVKCKFIVKLIQLAS